MVDLDQLLRQGLKAAKLSNFLFRFAYRTRGRQGLSNRFTGDFLGEPSLGEVSGVIGLSTMATGLATASVDGGNGTGLKIIELREFLQEMATAVEQFGQGVGHKELQVMI